MKNNPKGQCDAEGSGGACVSAIIAAILLTSISVAGCTTATPTPDAVATQVAMALAVEATLTALAPTETPVLTATPIPTHTLTPAPTPTATSTNTPSPTFTPVPTKTAAPTKTPTLAPPTGTPTAIPTPRPSPTSVPLDLAAHPGVGEMVHSDKWDFKVYAVHKRKAVYFYDNAYIAQGHFLVVLIEATNRQPGSAYFCELKPWIVDTAISASIDQRKIYRFSGKASGYASWQFGGVSSCYTDVNPGNLVRLAMVYDCPSDGGHLLMSLNILEWIYLGNFAAMPVED